MSSNLQSEVENFLDNWLTEQDFPTNVPFQMKVLTYMGYLQNEIDRLNPKKTRGAPQKKITKNMLRANKYLSAKEGLIKRGHENPTDKDVIEYLIQASNILYEYNAISREDRDLFTSVAPKSIQNNIKQGLRELDEFLKK